MTGIPSLLVLAGLGATALGAWTTAKSVILTESRAKQIAGTYIERNPTLKDALLAQSRSARRGMLWIGGGTVLQMIGVLLDLIV